VVVNGRRRPGCRRSAAVGIVAELAPERAWAVPVGDVGALTTGILALLRDQRAASGWAGLHKVGRLRRRLDRGTVRTDLQDVTKT
jgi:hypothetical protein